MKARLGSTDRSPPQCCADLPPKGGEVNLFSQWKPCEKSRRPGYLTCKQHHGLDPTPTPTWVVDAGKWRRAWLNELFQESWFDAYGWGQAQLVGYQPCRICQTCDRTKEWVEDLRGGVHLECLARLGEDGENHKFGVMPAGTFKPREVRTIEADLGDKPAADRYRRWQETPAGQAHRLGYGANLRDYSERKKE